MHSKLNDIGYVNMQLQCDGNTAIGRMVNAVAHQAYIYRSW